MWSVELRMVFIFLHVRKNFKREYYFVTYENYIKFKFPCIQNTAVFIHFCIFYGYLVIWKYNWVVVRGLCYSRCDLSFGISQRPYRNVKFWRMPHTYEVRIDRLGLWDCFFTVKLSSELSCRCSLVQCANYSYTNTVYCIVNFSDICHTLNVSTIIWVLCSLDLKVLASEYLKPFEN